MKKKKAFPAPFIPSSPPCAGDGQLSAGPQALAALGYYVLLLGKQKMKAVGGLLIPQDFTAPDTQG